MTSVGYRMTACLAELCPYRGRTAARLVGTMDSGPSTIHSALQRLERLRLVRRERGPRPAGRGTAPFIYYATDRGRTWLAKEEAGALLGEGTRPVPN